MLPVAQATNLEESNAYARAVDALLRAACTARNTSTYFHGALPYTRAGGAIPDAPPFNADADDRVAELKSKIIRRLHHAFSDPTNSAA